MKYFSRFTLRGYQILQDMTTQMNNNLTEYSQSVSELLTSFLFGDRFDLHTYFFQLKFHTT